MQNNKIDVIIATVERERERERELLFIQHGKNNQVIGTPNNNFSNQTANVNKHIVGQYVLLVVNLIKSENDFQCLQSNTAFEGA